MIGLLVKLLGGLWVLKDNCRKSRFARWLYIAYLRRQGSFIGFASQIAGPLITPHGMFGVLISEFSKIGKNCVIFQQVTIGSNTLPNSKRAGAPTIGDNCYIGAGAKIIGKVTIGDNVRIGANCVVFQDIPSNSVVVVPPPRIIHREKVDNQYYSKNPDHQWGYMNDGMWEIERDLATIDALNKSHEHA